jgi:RNA polymerase sigma-70 factor (ECF subfamily)
MTFAEVGVAELKAYSLEETKPTKAMVGTLYEQYYNRVVRYIFVRIGDQHEAENLGGDVFLKALHSIDSFRGNGDQMRGWIFKIAHNLVVDHLRKKSRRSSVSIDEDMGIPDGLNIEEVVEGRIEVARLAKALRKLTPAQREVIALRFFAGLPSAEVARMMSKSSGAVREMQHAAVEALRKHMHGQAEAGGG